MQGYSTGKVNNRMWGAPAYIGLFTLLGCVCTWGVGLLSAKK